LKSAQKSGIKKFGTGLGRRPEFQKFFAASSALYKRPFGKKWDFEMTVNM